MFLLSTIHSLINPKKIYGFQGDEVKTIKDCGNVMIVEGPDGNRFAVETKEFIEQSVKKSSVPDTTETIQPIINPRTLVEKAVSVKQQSLF